VGICFFVRYRGNGLARGDGCMHNGKESDQALHIGMGWGESRSGYKFALMQRDGWRTVQSGRGRHSGLVCIYLSFLAFHHGLLTSAELDWPVLLRYEVEVARRHVA